MTDSRLWPAAFAALAASLAFALATRPNIPDWQRLFFSASGFVLALYAAFNALDWLVLRGPQIVTAVNRLRFPQLDIAEAVRGLNEIQLAYALGSGVLERHAWSGGIQTVFVADGRELTADWFENYLSYCIGFGDTDLPSLRRHGNGSADQMDEQAAIHWLIAAGYVEPRPGQRFVWADGWTPAKVRGLLFGEDVSAA